MPDFEGVPLYRELERICCLPGKEITGWGLTLLLESFSRVDFGFAVGYIVRFFLFACRHFNKNILFHAYST